MATLAVNIDPSGALRGARVVRREMADIQKHAHGVERSTDRMGRVANDNLRDMARHTTLAERGFQRLSVMVRSFGAVLLTSLGAGAIVRTADAFTEMTNRLRVAGVAMADMADVQERLFGIANDNGVAITSLTQLYSRASIAAGELGASQDELLDFVRGTAAALRVQGGSAAEASGALLQLSQALGAGVVRAEEFNSILEGAFPIAQAAARGIEGMGGSVAKLRQAIVNGEISSRVFFEGLLKGFTATEAQAASMQMNVGQSLTVLGNSWVRFIGAVDTATGLTAALSSGIQLLGRGLDALAEHLDLIIKLVKIAGAGLLAAFAPRLLASMAAGLVTLGVAGVNAIHAITVAVAANPLGALFVAFTTLIVAAYEFRDEIKQAIGVDVVEVARTAANRIIGSFVGAYNAVVEAWKNLPVAFSAIGKQAWNSLVSEFEKPLFTLNGKTVIPGFDLSGIKSELSPEEQTALKGVTGAFMRGLNREFIAPFGAPDLPAARTSSDLSGGITNAIDVLSGKGGMTREKLDQFQRAVQLIKDRTDAIRLEQSILGQSVGVQEAARAEMDLLNAARDAGIKLGADELHTIRQLAGAYGQAVQELENLREAHERLDEIRDAGREAFRGIAQAMRDGKISGEELLGILDRLQTRLIDLAANQVFDSLFGAQGSGGFGFIGSLFAGGASSTGFNAPGSISGGLYARGGIARSPSIFGEAGPEAAVPLPDGRSIPVDLRSPPMNIKVEVIDRAGVRLETGQPRTGPNGDVILPMIIRQVEEAMVGSVHEGNLGRAIGSRFGLTHKVR